MSHLPSELPMAAEQLGSTENLIPVPSIPKQTTPLCAPSGKHLRLKRALDIIIAGLLLLLTSPVLLLSAILVKLSSRGPAFYSQVRLGLNGAPFWIYKVRSMVKNSEENGAQWSTPGDARITPLGHFLRKTHIDELPQLWNVLRGEMSLVGPRPERPEFVPQLEAAIPRYRERMLVRPGVTGLAQIQLPSDIDFDSVRKKLARDLFYVQGMSFWLDLRIMFLTGLKMLHLPQRWAARLLRLPGQKVVEESYRQLVAPDTDSPEILSTACTQSV